MDYVVIGPVEIHGKSNESTSDSVCHDGLMSLNEPAVTRVVGVYNARGTVLGELSYLLRRTFAGEHCALCDITHSSVRRRPDWDRCSRSFSLEFGIPVDLFHLDEVPIELSETVDFCVPAVFFQRSDQSFVIAAHPNELVDCNHSPEQLFALLRTKIGVES